MLKLTIIFLLALMQMAKSQAVLDPICSQPEASGFCRAQIIKYFYDQASGQCKQFIFGGCGGNQNNFDTIEECQTKCVKVSKCEQNFDIGPCRALVSRYFFNKQTKNCELFMYGGCDGNENNFENYDLCMKTCF